MFYSFIVCFGKAWDKKEAVNIELNDLNEWAESMHKLKWNSTDTYFTQ